MSIKSLAKSSGVYLISNIFSMGILFLLIPVLTRYLTPESYAVISMFEAVLAIIVPIVGLNLYGAISVNYYRSNEDIDEFIWNVFLLIVFMSIIVTILFFIFRSQLSGLLGIDVSWLLLIPLLALSKSFIQMLLTIWQVTLRPVFYGLFQSTQITIEILFAVYLVVTVGMAWEGRLEAMVVVNIFFGLLAIAILYKKNLFKVTTRSKHIRDALIFGVPLVLHSIGGWGMNMIDRFFVNSMVSAEAMGVYTVGYQIGMVVFFVTSAFNLAWTPYFFKNLKKAEDEPSVKIWLVKFTYIYAVILLASSIGFGVIAPWFLKFFVGGDFLDAQKYVIWIALGYAFNGMYYMMANYLFYIKKTRLLAYITFLCMIVNIFANYILINKNGAIGAAQATCYSFLLFFILTFILSSRSYKMPWFWWRNA